jgi:hypothetical protein
MANQRPKNELLMFHFRCPLCGAEPDAVPLREYLSEWAKSPSSRLRHLLELFSCSLSATMSGNSRWIDRRFGNSWTSVFLSLHVISQYFPLNKVQGVEDIDYLSFSFLQDCPVCGTSAGIRGKGPYFTLWGDACKVQTANLLYETNLILWAILRRLPDWASGRFLGDLNLFRKRLLATCEATGLLECPQCGRFTTTLYGPGAPASDRYCRWCADTTRGTPIAFNFDIDSEQNVSIHSTRPDYREAALNSRDVLPQEFLKANYKYDDSPQASGATAEARNGTISRTLSDIQSIFPPLLYVDDNITDRLSPAEWQEKANLSLDLLSRGWQLLVDSAQLLLSQTVFRYSKCEYVYTAEPNSYICKIRLRPQNDYYLHLNEPVPKPENPQGHDATGIEISLNVYRPYLIHGILHDIEGSLNLTIWGLHERVGFRSFFNKHKKMLGALLSKSGFALETACAFDELESYRSSNVLKRLDLYFQVDDDPENNFSLTRSFFMNSLDADIVKEFLVLLSIYDSCYFYCTKRKQYNRILSHYSKLKDNGVLN